MDDDQLTLSSVRSDHQTSSELNTILLIFHLFPEIIYLLISFFYIILVYILIIFRIHLDVLFLITILILSWTVDNDKTLIIIGMSASVMLFYMSLSLRSLEQISYLYEFFKIVKENTGLILILIVLYFLIGFNLGFNRINYMKDDFFKLYFPNFLAYLLSSIINYYYFPVSQTTTKFPFLSYLFIIIIFSPIAIAFQAPYILIFVAGVIAGAYKKSRFKIFRNWNSLYPNII